MFPVFRVSWLLEKHNSYCLWPAVTGEGQHLYRTKTNWSNTLKDKNLQTQYSHTPAGRVQHLRSESASACVLWITSDGHMFTVKRVICLHCTTRTQPPRAIISSDLPKHKHPETGSPANYRQDPLERNETWAHNGPFRDPWGSGRNPTPKQRRPRSRIPVFYFDLHLHQHMFTYRHSS